jgi:hypothetical protein
MIVHESFNRFDSSIRIVVSVRIAAGECTGGHSGSHCDNEDNKQEDWNYTHQDLGFDFMDLW